MDRHQAGLQSLYCWGPLDPGEGDRHCSSPLRPGTDPRKDGLPAKHPSLHRSYMGGLDEGSSALEVALGTGKDQGCGIGLLGAPSVQAQQSQQVGVWKGPEDKEPDVAPAVAKLADKTEERGHRRSGLCSGGGCTWPSMSGARPRDPVRPVRVCGPGEVSKSRPGLGCPGTKVQKPVRFTDAPQSICPPPTDPRPLKGRLDAGSHVAGRTPSRSWPSAPCSHPSAHVLGRSSAWPPAPLWLHREQRSQERTEPTPHARCSGATKRAETCLPRSGCEA